MGVTVVAADYTVAALAGRLTFALGLPLVGLTLLVIGLWERSRSRRRPSPGYPYPPPMGYPYPYPGPAYPGYPPHVPPPRPHVPPPRRASKSSTTLITVGSVVLTLGILGDVASAATGLARHQQRTSMRVGECITQTSYRSESFSSSTNNDCANPMNTYQLAFKGGSSATCPDGRREGSYYDRYTDSSTILCFALNLKQGQCYEFGSDTSHPTITLSNCSTAASRRVRVVARIDGSTDESECPAGAKGVGYPSPAVVYCLAREP